MVFISHVYVPRERKWIASTYEWYPNIGKAEGAMAGCSILFSASDILQNCPHDLDGKVVYNMGWNPSSGIAHIDNHQSSASTLTNHPLE
jgi:hypothetical protein